MPEKRAKDPDKDRMPPESEDMEQSVLGSLLLDPALIPGIGLKSEDFYHARHQLVYEATLALHGRKDPVDIITITEELTKRGKLEAAGGAGYIAVLLDAVPSAQSAAHYAGKVRELAVLRKMIEQAKRTMLRAYAREDANEIMAELGTFTSTPDYSPTLGVLEYFDIEKLLAEGKAYGHGGKDTGYPELNKAFRIMPQELTIITARIGQGKSSLAYNLILNFISRYPDETFIYFNLDTSFPIVASRMATIKAARDYGVRYSYEKDVLPGYQSGTFPNEIAQVLDDFKEYGHEKRLALVNRPGYRVEELVGYAERYARTRKLGAVFVDYMELIQATGKHDTEELRIAHITNTLRIASERLSTPFIVLVQQSRGDNKDEGGEPTLASLRYSGRQEQEAAKVLGLLSTPTEEKLTAITLKNRGGQPSKRIHFDFDMKSGLITGEKPAPGA